MGKVRKESNEWDEEEASQPVPIIDEGMRRLESLRNMYIKPPPKPRKLRPRKRK